MKKLILLILLSPIFAKAQSRVRYTVVIDYSRIPIVSVLLQKVDNYNSDKKLISSTTFSLDTFIKAEEAFGTHDSVKILQEAHTLNVPNWLKKYPKNEVFSKQIIKYGKDAIDTIINYTNLNSQGKFDSSVKYIFYKNGNKDYALVNGTSNKELFDINGEVMTTNLFKYKLDNKQRISEQVSMRNKERILWKYNKEGKVISKATYIGKKAVNFASFSYDRQGNIILEKESFKDQNTMITTQRKYVYIKGILQMEQYMVDNEIQDHTFYYYE
jgi:hypothetical protein